MKKILLFLIISQLCFSQVFETTAIFESGSRDKRINMVVLGDGFTAEQQADFIANATSLVNYVFSKQPYAQYKNYFNVYAIKVISAESGVKHPGTATDVTEPIITVTNPNNFLGSSFDVGGTHRCLYSNSTNKVTNVLASNVPDFDIAFILGNSTEYGGCGGTYAFLSKHSQANEIVVHELGHSFGKLADEYWFSGSGESPNKTQNSNIASNKWKNWSGTNGVGIYAYEENPNWFRPHQNCEMRYLNREFCSVCKQQLIERVHFLQNPIDSFTPSNTSAINLTGELTFSVNEILPVPNTLENTWSVNGSAISNTSSSATISPETFTNGVNTVLFSVVDKNSLLKIDNHEVFHVSTISWTVNKTLSAIDVKANQRNFQVYPNPAKSQIFIKDETKNLKNITVEIYDATGRNLKNPRVQNLSSTEVSVNVDGLLPQTYIIKVYENKALILTQKIIKE
ncbi:T9SS type A sorting domain-containing protein [Kaistella flava (ex Peng et al. 2021)]|uniref:T9SS type A sorting domain-containing protein n=1 Tax=Kaistella flava (ex Peng et al. 2021) TaxID=2038776 RepID=A0A7M2YD09_9FLAO|nr:M64 family metallopeptidase [Kaistella flava (ex Peng et al. 2021)]QOW11514.1 T9SS type A sorting domain-containing protein [Kaistella flava (ex Peng et al. 2021)]